MTYRILRSWHTWLGVILALVLLVIACSGILLLLKKDFAWIQPPTQKGAAGDTAAFITLAQVIDAAVAQGHPDFTTPDDIDRIDVRPGKRVAKVRSKHHHAEIQVDLVTGEVLSTAVRRSDLIEQIHDGSWFGAWYERWIGLPAADGMIVLTLTGLYLWIVPQARRHRRAGTPQETP